MTIDEYLLNINPMNSSILFCYRKQGSSLQLNIVTYLFLHFAKKNDQKNMLTFQGIYFLALQN